MLKVLHLSTTPLVGAPGNLCRALNESGLAQARWAVLADDVGAYGTLAYPLDLRWQHDREQILALAQACDLLHLHNFIDLGSQAFAPLDFGALWAAGKPMVRQFHSQPGWIARLMGQTEAEVQACPIPKLVIAQFQERYYPSARPVRNLCFVPPRAPREAGRHALRIGYAPSRFNSARSARWDTKGYPETVAMLRRLQRLARRGGLPLEVDLIEQVSHAECLRRKALCDLFVDELVTGSYHLNTLEALAMGVACVTYVDARTAAVVRDVTGGHDLPVVNVGLEDALPVLLDLCARPEAVHALGAQGRAWMQRHWAAADLASALLQTYRDVLARPRQPFAARFDDSSPAQRWLVREQHDALWRARATRWPAPPNGLLLKARSAAGSLWRSVRAHAPLRADS